MKNKFIQWCKWYIRIIIIKFKSRPLKEIKVARLIGQFYVQQNRNLKDINKIYKKANEDIIMLHITRIQVKGNIITITLTRPGLLIGRRGENIDALTNFLSKELKHKITLNIIEDMINGHLFPYNPQDYDDILD